MDRNTRRNVTVFAARRVRTMDDNRPEASHIAVADGRVVAVGDASCGEGWGDVTHDDRFADAVILPGLIEAHAHVMAGGVWRYSYLGHYARQTPEGRTVDGVPSTAALVERVAAIARETPGDGPVVAWGVDPNFLDGPRLSRDDLDRATDRPVVALHSNFHLLTANSAALEAAGMEGVNVEGVMRDESGRLTGELQEFAAMGPVMRFAGVDFASLSNDPDAVRAYAKVARGCGVTTAADLLSDLSEDEVAMLARVTAEEGFAIRYVPMMNAMEGDPQDEAARALALRKHSTDRLVLGGAKLFTDGAIQGFTAKLRAPGYFTGEDHGVWNMPLDHFRAAVKALLAAGVQTHIHTNGDAASDEATDAVEAALLAHPVGDHRTVLEHVQLAGGAEFARMKALGMTVNLFTNHVHYFGDIHYTRTLGPDRAERMDAARDAHEVFGDGFAIHSDAPVTPMAPLATASYAVERMTQGGRRLGERQRIGAEAALRLITRGAAHVLKLEHEIGSLACGKRADFCVLERDPMEVEPSEWPAIGVRATVIGGRVNP